MTLPQGDLRLLDSDIARRMLGSTELARLAYVASDDTPRVLPMLFHWNGEEVVLPTFAGTAKLKALRARPAVAITIDNAGPPPGVLLIRGRAEVTEVDGVVPEYALAQQRYYGPEQAATVAELGKTGVRMARIAVRPSWVGTIDFVTRFPGARSAEEFARIGQ
ncbi:pyridoxamine 5'-phosphate oxidase family protein [Amycolatopsis acidiphila]|uniref:Pyridoxamine 5'-phosphate oxidase n=1 Tax=Amycolatopsis acidiphila TaxID=715473 RepID=A0A558A8P0_9PSEU|nr:pyridoxamine 5'-phosphate oxidase family protein [Amycolatopsis acidiphila]TVT20623.1 pyridoxamine 5'-phosphate oxidase [Amycolatopsis acidiphila]UIJ61379.1 pyridoxamine 5'-phosphate oxidase family protein [Amycolatopsis acidiphila]GHG77955.1 pyridoxamine 5'-phosphate oxidase [Amycolatopsis acidiphila]